MVYQYQIDDVFQQWITQRRCGDDVANGLVLERIRELVADGFPLSVSLFERSYLELLNSGEIKPFREPFVPTPERERLTVEQYNRMPAHQIAKKYMTDQVFRADVDDLIRRKLI